jgi:hypothetical protein
MPIKMQHLVGLSRALGAAQGLGELFEGGRSQCVKLHDCGGLARQAAQDAAGDRAEGHVGAAGRPGDGEQDADLGRAVVERGAVGRPRGAGRVGLAAHEGLAGQRQWLLSERVAQQLPGDGGGLSGVGDDLDARRVEAVGQARPEALAGGGRLEHRAEERVAELGHARFDAPRDAGRGVEDCTAEPGGGQACHCLPKPLTRDIQYTIADLLGIGPAPGAGARTPAWDRSRDRPHSASYLS